MRKRNNDLILIILNEIKINHSVTQKELSKKYKVHERTIRRYYKILKDNNYIEYIVNEKEKKWKINKNY